MSDGYGVVVIGSGPGGYTAALEAARSGFRTALVERRPYLGGVCLNEGCIASKTLLSAADVLEEIERGGVFGVTASGVEQDWGRLQARRVEVIETLRAGVGGLLRAAKVDVVTGEARLGGAHEVVVTHEGVETVLSAERVVLATGSSPIVPGPWQGVEGVLSSTEMLSIDPLPKSATLVGGGVIGCEFASMMIRFGVDVRVIEMADRLLPMADEAVSSALADALRRQGVVLHLGRKVERIEPGGDGCAIALDDGSSWSSEKVLVAVGRSPNTGGMGLEEAGVSLDARGYVEVDEELRTSAGWVWCIGDANGKTMLAHAAMSQARGAVRSMLGVGEAYAAVVPWCVYTSPEVGWVGVTAEEAEASGGKAYAGDFPYAALGKAHAGGDASGMFRVVVDAEGVVVGGQVVGRHATEIINVLAVMVAGGMDVSKLHAVALAHPTLGEGVGEAAAAALGLATHVPAPRAKSASAGVLAGV